MDKLWCTSAQISSVSDLPTPRAGSPWSGSEIALLHGLIYAPTPPSLVLLCREFGRSVSGIVSKAKALGFLRTCANGANSYSSDYYINPRKAGLYAAQPTQPIEEISMPTKNIENVVMIRGEDASSKSDDQIFDLIAKLEGSIKSLNGIDNKPKKLMARIDELKADISKLVEYVDTRAS